MAEPVFESFRPKTEIKLLESGTRIPMRVISWMQKKSGTDEYDGLGDPQEMILGCIICHGPTSREHSRGRDKRLHSRWTVVQELPTYIVP